MISGQLWRFRDKGVHSLNELEQRRFGTREGLLRILDVLDEYGVKAQFFVSAHEARISPFILPEIARRGHHIGMHAVVHEMVHTLSPAYFAEILDTSIDVFQKQLGRKPEGFRAPAWDLTPDCIRELKKRDVVFDSSLSGYDHPYEMDGLTEIPIQWALDDVLFFRYYGGGIDHWIPVGTGEVTARWKESLEAACRWNELCLLTMHPWVTGRGIRIGVLEEMLKTACLTRGLWITTPAEMAAYHNRSANAGVFAQQTDLPVYPEKEHQYVE